MIIITYEACGELKVKRIARKGIEDFKFDPRYDSVIVTLESGAYQIYHHVKTIEILEGWKIWKNK